MVSAGLYLHIPYCKQACSYCDFYFSTRTHTQPAVVAAMCQEIALRAKVLPYSLLHSIYLGGGTPSLLTTSQLSDLFAAIHTHYTLLPGSEVTLEANPDDITPEAVETWKSLGINRLSVGVQTFQPQVLQDMRRAHTAHQAHAALRLVADAFETWTADLIFAVPDRPLPMLQADVAALLAYAPPHLSVYGLTVEAGTLLHHQVQRGQVLVDDAQYAEEFLWLHDALTQTGYVHYEISNYARPGYMANHNSSYWQGAPYVGIGPGAHGYHPPTRRYANLPDLHAYVAALEKQALHQTEETLSPAQLLMEKVMLELRTAKGLDVKLLYDSPGWTNSHQQTLDALIAQGHFELRPPQLMATPKGWLALDSLLLDILPDA
jgi:oxygen-independent coproporphyrinogen-3 oxidase